MKKILFITLMFPMISNASEALLGSCKEQVRTVVQYETRLPEITFDQCQWSQGQVVCNGQASNSMNSKEFSVGVMPNCEVSFVQVQGQ